MADHLPILQEGRFRAVETRYRFVRSCPNRSIDRRHPSGNEDWKQGSSQSPPSRLDRTEPRTSRHRHRGRGGTDASGAPPANPASVGLSSDGRPMEPRRFHSPTRRSRGENVPGRTPASARARTPPRPQRLRERSDRVHLRTRRKAAPDRRRTCGVLSGIPAQRRRSGSGSSDSSAASPREITVIRRRSG